MKLWVVHAKLFARESKRNNEHTVAVLCKRHDFILLHNFFDFFWFLIRNFNSFCSFFYYCNWRKSSHHHAHSRHNANSKWLIFPTTMLIPGNTSIREGRVFIFSQIFINGLTKSSWINKCKTIVVISSIAAHEGSRD